MIHAPNRGKPVTHLLNDQQRRAYAGRWVALVQGRVAGVGLTAEAAQVAAQLSRPKEKA